MPNILSHLRITAEVMETRHPDALLGSVLSDFDGMYRDYSGKPVVKGEPSSTEYLNSATDRVYDSRMMRHIATSTLTQCIRSQDIPEGDAWVVPFAGKAWSDVVLDGLQLRDRFTCELFRDVGRALALRETRLEYQRPDKGYQDAVALYFDDLPTEYTDPVWMVDRLFKRLACRSGTRKRPLSKDTARGITAAYGRWIEESRGVGVSGKIIRDTVRVMKAGTHDEFDVKVGFGDTLSILGEYNPLSDVKLHPSQLAARRVLHQLCDEAGVDVAYRDLLRSHHGYQAVLPDSCTASLSHDQKTGSVAAVLAKKSNGLLRVGIDIQSLNGLRGLARAIPASELETITASGFGRADIAAASIRESAYKAFSPFDDFHRTPFRGSVKLEELTHDNGVIRGDIVPISDRLKTGLRGLKMNFEAVESNGHVTSLVKVKKSNGPGG
jgi:4'-phosphopantetheinyl transferase EntD